MQIYKLHNSLVVVVLQRSWNFNCYCNYYYSTNVKIYATPLHTYTKLLKHVLKFSSPPACWAASDVRQSFRAGMLPKNTRFCMVCAGRLFNACAAATGNARSPRVARRVDGTSSVGLSTERRRRRATTSDVSCRLSARYAGAVSNVYLFYVPLPSLGLGLGTTGLDYKYKTAFTGPNSCLSS